jgi:predicted permease
LQVKRPGVLKGRLACETSKGLNFTGMTLAIGMPGGLEWIFVLVAFCLTLILPILAISDIVKGDFRNPNDKLIWILIVLFMPIVGSMIYFWIGKGQKKIGA